MTGHNEEKQVQSFVEKARELGCDEDQAAFDERLKQTAKAPPPKPTAKEKKHSS
jgi:hypothetical protein